MSGCLIESMARYIGQTVTIFTKSGGLSGNGFTGVLAGICDGWLSFNFIQTRAANISLLIPHARFFTTI